MEIPVLSKKLTNEVIDLEFPCVKALVTSDALALFLETAEKGDLPLVCEHEGDLFQVALLRKSAIVLDNLRSITPIEWYFDNNNYSELKTAEDILEVL